MENVCITCKYTNCNNRNTEMINCHKYENVMLDKIDDEYIRQQNETINKNIGLPTVALQVFVCDYCHQQMLDKCYVCGKEFKYMDSISCVRNTVKDFTDHGYTRHKHISCIDKGDK